jgi:hypothetical protein
MAVSAPRLGLRRICHPQVPLAEQRSADQRISGGLCSHGGAEARRKQREEWRSQRPTTRATGVSRAFACVLNTRGCLQAFCTAPVIHPHGSILCGYNQVRVYIKSSRSPRTTDIPLCCSSWAVSGLYLPKTALVGSPCKSPIRRFGLVRSLPSREKLLLLARPF